MSEGPPRSLLPDTVVAPAMDETGSGVGGVPGITQAQVPARIMPDVAAHVELVGHGVGGGAALAVRGDGAVNRWPERLQVLANDIGVALVFVPVGLALAWLVSSPRDQAGVQAQASMQTQEQEQAGGHCYWMENYSGHYRWVDAEPVYHRILSLPECRALDSCSGRGGGQSGGGCYKWASSPRAPGVP